MKINSIPRLIPGLISVAFCLAMITDAYTIGANPEKYIEEYGISPSERQWAYQSVENMQLQSLGYAALFLGMAVWGFYIYNRKRKIAVHAAAQN
ncbi:MAG: hypothetical protein ACO1N9_10985 [Flavobacterium sp.]